MIISKEKKVISGIIISFFALFISIIETSTANAISFAVSPMNNFVVLNPGESYESAFTVFNPTNNEDSINYEVKMEHFYEGDDGAVLLEDVGTTGQILEWTKLESADTGVLAPGEKADINYSINVPEDAAGGGQYVAFTVEAKDNSKTNESKEGTNATLEQKTLIAYRVFAEIAGDINRQGEVQDINVPSFLLSGNIKGTSSIKNTGNVHGEAKYKLQVFPLFSDEEIYTNEEDPQTATILPDRTRYEETAWENTPSIGIFNVKYTVEFEGVTAEVSKMVIICPIWLLFLIIFIIIAIIIWIAVRVKGRKGNKASA